MDQNGIALKILYETIFTSKGMNKNINFEKTMENEFTNRYIRFS